jgi:hypothetical protein
MDKAWMKGKPSTRNTIERIKHFKLIGSPKVKIGRKTFIFSNNYL